MKRILKIVVPLLLIAVLVAGVFPVTSQAASKTTYNVTLIKGSASASVISMDDGTPAVMGGSLEGVTFQMIVENKLKTEKVKSTGQKASYYPVKVPKKSWKEVTQQEYQMMDGSGRTAIKFGYLNKDGKGKLYVSGGDVDYAAVTQGKKTKWSFGNGKEDPEGSMLLEMETGSALAIKGTTKVLSKVVQKVYLTTGTCSLIVQNTKGKIDGKKLPDDAKSTKTLPDPFTGEVVDLDEGTGTLLGVSSSMDAKNALAGAMIDNLTANVWVMKISK